MTKRKGELTEAEFTDAAIDAELKAEGIELEEGGVAVATMDPPETVAPVSRAVPESSTDAAYEVEGGQVYVLSAAIHPDAIAVKVEFLARMPNASQLLKEAVDAR